METLFGLMIGIGLSAACGFRVFVPLLGMAVASHSGHLSLAPGFEWIGSWPAIVAFATATLLEIGAYWIPWLDHLMDAGMTPFVIVTGTITTASMVGEMSPFLKWSLAAIAGGGVASLVQAGTVAIRATSSGTTAGMGNPLVSTGELIASMTMTALALFAPLLGVVVVIGVCFWTARKILKYLSMRRDPHPH